MTIEDGIKIALKAREDEIDRLRTALEQIASHNGEPALDGAAHKIARATVQIARAALKETSNG